MWMRGYLFQLAAQLASDAQTLEPSLRIHIIKQLYQNQTPDGGFCGREMNTKISSKAIPFSHNERCGDLYYTAFGLRILSMLGVSDQSIYQRINTFLHTQREYAICTASLPEWISWFQSLKMLTALGVEPATLSPSEERSCFLQRINTIIRTPGCFAQTCESRESSTYATFLIHATQELLDDDPIESMASSTSSLAFWESMLQFLRERQNPDGGFSELVSLSRSGLNPSAAAIAILKILYTYLNAHVSYSRNDEMNGKNPSKNLPNHEEWSHLVRSAIFGATRFLSTVRGPHGGFYAHTSLPCEDLLSTFTALVMTRDMKAMVDDFSFPLTILEREKLIRWHQKLMSGVSSFAESLWWKDSGFRAGWFDEMTDIEYTFYGLGCLALCEKTSI